MKDSEKLKNMQLTADISRNLKRNISMEYNTNKKLAMPVTVWMDHLNNYHVIQSMPIKEIRGIEKALKEYVASGPIKAGKKAMWLFIITTELIKRN